MTVSFNLFNEILNNTTIGGITWIIPTAVFGVLLFTICKSNMNEMKSVALPLMYGLHITGLRQNMIFMLIAAFYWASSSMSLSLIGMAASYVGSLRENVQLDIASGKKHKFMVKNLDMELKTESSKILTDYRNIPTDSIASRFGSKLNALKNRTNWQNREEDASTERIVNRAKRETAEKVYNEHKAVNDLRRERAESILRQPRTIADATIRSWINEPSTRPDEDAKRYEAFIKMRELYKKAKKKSSDRSVVR